MELVVVLAVLMMKIVGCLEAAQVVVTLHIVVWVEDWAAAPAAAAAAAVEYSAAAANAVEV